MISRRGFTAGLGATLLAGPFAQLLSPARAQGVENTRRLLLFFSPNGVIHRHWRPTGGLRDFAFPQGSVLEPLSRHRDDLVVIDGLNFLTGNNHEGGQAAMLTNRGGGSTPTRGMSLDQFIASQIGASDRFSSLEFGVLTDIWGAGQQTRISYRGPGELVHPDADPRRAFTRLFGAIGGGRGAEDRLRSRRQGILDLARGELADLHRRVGRVEQAKLEAHLASLASVEQGLLAGAAGGCDAPLAPDPLNKDQNDNVPALLDAQMRLAVTALSCGQTKVASVQLSHTVSPVVFTWAGNNEGHHSLSHAGDGQVAQVTQFINAERWVAEQFGGLIDLLKAAPDPATDGSLFDSTVVIWAKEMGDPRAHVCTDVPFVLAGGGLEGGRYLHYDGEPHSKLLVSICTHFGLRNQTFGDPNTSMGGLAGLV